MGPDPGRHGPAPWHLRPERDHPARARARRLTGPGRQRTRALGDATGTPHPFVYVADGDADELVLPGPTPAAVPARQFGELVFHDAELLDKAGNTEVIAVVPHGSPAGTRPSEGSLPDEGARNSARNWWTTRGAPTLHHDPATGTYTVAMLPGPDGQPAPTGTWGPAAPRATRRPTPRARRACRQLRGDAPYGRAGRARSRGRRCPRRRLGRPRAGAVRSGRGHHRGRNDGAGRR